MRIYTPRHGVRPRHGRRWIVSAFREFISGLMDPEVSWG